MAKVQPSYFVLMNGLQGCYMPDYVSSPYMVTRRKDLVAAVRAYLEFNDYPLSYMKQIKWRNVWNHCKRHGASSLHFTIDVGNNYGVHFSGMTEEEFNRAEAEQDL